MGLGKVIIQWRSDRLYIVVSTSWKTSTESVTKFSTITVIDSASTKFKFSSTLPVSTGIRYLSTKYLMYTVQRYLIAFTKSIALPSPSLRHGQIRWLVDLRKQHMQPGSSRERRGALDLSLAAYAVMPGSHSF